MNKKMPADRGDKIAAGLIAPQPGSQPVSDLAAFLETLPMVEENAIEAIEQAIRENRAERRAATESGAA